MAVTKVGGGEATVALTKLQIPALPQPPLRRSRLTRALDAGGPRPVTLVVAPAGFGKTTAVADWASQRAATQGVAWLALGQGDDDARPFWSHIVEAINVVEPDTLMRTTNDIERGKTPVGEGFAHKMINELSGIEPLTDREIAVLRYLPTRLTNKDIAGELFVSVNTIKSHLKAIYRKLDVSTRNEAVTRVVDARLV